MIGIWYPKSEDPKVDEDHYYSRPDSIIILCLLFVDSFLVALADRQHVAAAADVVSQVDSKQEKSSNPFKIATTSNTRTLLLLGTSTGILPCCE